jgi:hypothetical protein
MPTLTPILNLGGQPTGLLGMGGRLSSDAFSNLGGAVSDLFAGQSAAEGASIKAGGLRLSATGLRFKAQGDLAEASNYDLAAELARKNEAYTERSTEIQQMQLDRQITGAAGTLQAETGRAGLKMSGSAIDILADSAAQGRLAKDVLTQQGLIPEAGYEEQAKSFDTMSAATRNAAAGEMQIAAGTDTLAAQTEELGKKEQQHSYITAALKGAAALASLF